MERQLSIKGFLGLFFLTNLQKEVIENNFYIRENFVQGYTKKYLHEVFRVVIL